MSLPCGLKDFFQAEDGIRDGTVTGVQTCALPILPRTIASFAAFENAMSLDVSMGGSTNTVLHLLAAAHEAGVDFTMKDIDRISRHVPCLCKVAPATAKFHMEDVHRAGGVMGILGDR